MFTDEMGSQLGMTRSHARSLKGHRACGTMIRNRGTNTTSIGAIRPTQVQASFVFEGTTDQSACMTFVSEVLVPTLVPGQIVVIDNLGSHRVKAVGEAIESSRSLCPALPSSTPSRSVGRRSDPFSA